MLALPASITTLRNADPVIDFFIDDHPAIGFSHFILFFDDPDDISLPLVEKQPDLMRRIEDIPARAARAAVPA